MPRTKRNNFKFYLCSRFGSLTDAAPAIEIDYFRLSRFISRAIDLKDDELKQICNHLKVNRKSLDDLVK